MRRWRKWGAGMSLLGAVLLAAGLPCLADGFDPQYFNGTFKEIWEQLQAKLKQPTREWRVRGWKWSKRTTTYREALLHRLLLILKYVDPYNDAADAPPWMHTESGREYARASAVEILHQMGKKVVPHVWEALESDIRFDTPARRKALRMIRVTQDKVRELAFKLRQEMRRFERLKKILDRPVTPRDVADWEFFYAWSDLINAWERTGAVPVSAPGKPAAASAQNAYRPFPQGPIFIFPIPNAPPPGPNLNRLVSLLYNEPEAGRDAKIKKLVTELSTARGTLASRVARFNQDHGRALVMGADMIPSEDFREGLETVLTRIGQAALPLLARGAKSNNRRVAQTAKRIGARIQAQKEPIQPKGLLAWEGLAERRVRLALEVWNLGDKRPRRPIAARAQKALKHRGLKAIPDILEIMRLGSMKKECRLALELLTGIQAGDDPERWRQWYEVNVLKRALVIESRVKPGAAEAGEAAEDKEKAKGGLRIGQRGHPPEALPKAPSLFPPLKESAPKKKTPKEKKHELNAKLGPRREKPPKRRVKQRPKKSAQEEEEEEE